MTTLYKLTDSEMRTHGGFQWTLGVPAPKLSGKGNLCGPGWYHLYTDPLLAVLQDPIHGDRGHGERLFEATGEVGITDHGLMVGCRMPTLVREIPLPVVTTEQRVRFAIFCSLAVPQSEAYRAWARAWLSGADRTEVTARAAADAAWTADAAAAARAARSAAWAAAKAARWATRAERAAAAAAQLDLVALARKAMSEEGA